MDNPIFVRIIEDNPGLRKSLSSNAATTQVISFLFIPKFCKHFSAVFVHRSEIGSPSELDFILSPSDLI